MRAALSPTLASNVELRHPVVAAWDAGGLLSQLAFHLRQAWLLFDPGQNLVARSLWHQLSICVRDLTTDPLQREQLVLVVQRAEADWNSSFGSEWHADEQHEINARGTTLALAGMTCAEIREACCQQLLSSVEALLRDARTQLLKCLTNPQIEIFQFAEFIGNTQFSPAIYREMYDDPIDVDRTVNRISKATQTTDAHLFSLAKKSPERPREWYLPTRSREQSLVQTSKQWFVELRHWFAQTVADEDSLEQFIAEPLVVLRQHLRDQVVRAVGRVEGVEAAKSEMKVGADNIADTSRRKQIFPTNPLVANLLNILADPQKRQGRTKTDVAKELTDGTNSNPHSLLRSARRWFAARSTERTAASEADT